MFCEICKVETGYKLTNIWEKHMMKFHNMSSQDYYNYINNVTQICPVCNKSRRYISYSKGYKCTCGNGFICLLCNSSIKRPCDMGVHLKFNHHGVTIKDYYDKCHKKITEGLCLECGAPTNFKSITKGYHKFCSLKCVQASEQTQKLKKATTLIRYGVDHPSKDKDVKLKQYLGRGFTKEDFDNIELNKSDFYMYSYKARKMLSKKFRKTLYNSATNCFYTNTVFDDKYTKSIDHVMSIAYGFANNIPLYLISGSNNLKVVRLDINISKNKFSLFDSGLLSKIDENKNLDSIQKNYFKNIISTHNITNFI